MVTGLYFNCTTHTLSNVSISINAITPDYLKSTDCLALNLIQIMDPLDFSWNPLSEPEFKWYDRNLVESVNNDEEATHKFFRLLALCHTVMPEDKNGRLDYQAQSPDEAALVSAARNFGYVFRARTPNSITIEVKGQKEVCGAR